MQEHFDPARDVVVVAYGLGAAGPFEVALSVGEAWDVVFVYDGGDGHARITAPFLEAAGYAFDVRALGYRELFRRLERTRVAGVVTFSESMVALTQRLAMDLGCRTNSIECTVALTDKLAQRERLNAAGVSCTRSAAVVPEQWGRAIDIVGLPAVLKRRRAAASRVRVIRSPDDLWRELAVTDEPTLLEEMLVGQPRSDELWLGDYVSVESVVDGERIVHFAVTDKLPLADDFVESGHLLPSTLPPAERREVTDLATTALRALGLRVGVTHTEIKLTPVGPRVIEVNGRLGGPIHRLMQLCADLDPIRLALDVSTGRRVSPQPVFHGHAAAVGLVAPPDAQRVLALPPATELRALPGACRVQDYRQAGDELGRNDYPWLQTVDIVAPTRTELVERAQRTLAVMRERAIFAASGLGVPA